MRRAAHQLQQALAPLGIAPDLQIQEISAAAFLQDPLQSNQVLIAGQPIEHWLGGQAGRSRCCPTTRRRSPSARRRRAVNLRPWTRLTLTQHSACTAYMKREDHHQNSEEYGPGAEQPQQRERARFGRKDQR